MVLASTKGNGSDVFESGRFGVGPAFFSSSMFRLPTVSHACWLWLTHALTTSLWLRLPMWTSLWLLSVTQTPPSGTSTLPSPATTRYNVVPITTTCIGEFRTICRCRTLCADFKIPLEETGNQGPPCVCVGIKKIINIADPVVCLRFQQIMETLK